MFYDENCSLINFSSRLLPVSNNSLNDNFVDNLILTFFTFLTSRLPAVALTPLDSGSWIINSIDDVNQIKLFINKYK